jgi:hypothetical protein
VFLVRETPPRDCSPTEVKCCCKSMTATFPVILSRPQLRASMSWQPGVSDARALSDVHPLRSLVIARTNDCLLSSLFIILSTLETSQDFSIDASTPPFFVCSRLRFGSAALAMHSIEYEPFHLLFCLY